MSKLEPGVINLFLRKNHEQHIRSMDYLKGILKLFKGKFISELEPVGNQSVEKVYLQANSIN